MAWSDIIGLFRGENKRPAGGAETEEGNPSPESAALRRALHAEEPDPQVSSAPATVRKVHEPAGRPVFSTPLAYPATPEAVEPPQYDLLPMRPEWIASQAAKPAPVPSPPGTSGLTLVKPEPANTAPEEKEPEGLEPSELEPGSLDSSELESSELDSGELDSNELNSNEPEPHPSEPAPASTSRPAFNELSPPDSSSKIPLASDPVPRSPVTPFEAPAAEPANFTVHTPEVPEPPAPVSSPLSETEALVDRWAVARRSGSRPVYAAPSQPAATEPQSWARFAASVPPPPPRTAPRFTPPPPQPRAVASPARTSWTSEPETRPVAEEPESYVVLPDPDPPNPARGEASSGWTTPLPETAPPPGRFPVSEPSSPPEPEFVPAAAQAPEALPPFVETPAVQDTPRTWASRGTEAAANSAFVPAEPRADKEPEQPAAWPLTVSGPSTPEWPASRTSSSASRFAMLRAVAQRWNQPLSERRFLVAAGSRAEARRLAPVIRALRARGVAAHGLDEVCVCASGDDPQSVREALELLDIGVDCHLSVEGVNQGLDALRARLINSFESLFAQVKPQWLIVAGDTMMTGMASLAAYYANIHVARVDAGHATATAGDELQPDEIYRQLVDLFSSVHFTETEWSKERLIHEGVLEANILVTGNTGVDALYESCQRLHLPLGPLSSRSSGVSRVLVSVGHSSLPNGSAGEICRAIGNLAVLVPGLYEFTWPLPSNSEAADAIHNILARVPGVVLTPPASYEEFLRHLSHCDFVLTDSPDLLEEAPSLGKPVLLLGAAGQRNEAIRTGVAIPVSPDSKSIQVAVRGLARKLSTRHGQITNPYGDGKASARIADFFDGRRVLEFGHTALPRLVAAGDEPLRIADPVTRWRLES